jgi:hypothetical protein
LENLKNNRNLIFKTSFQLIFILFFHRPAFSSDSNLKKNLLNILKPTSSAPITCEEKSIDPAESGAFSEITVSGLFKKNIQINNIKENKTTILHFKDCAFNGGIDFNNSKIQNLVFEGCTFKDVTRIINSKINYFQVTDCNAISKGSNANFSIHKSEIENIFLNNNPIYDDLFFTFDRTNVDSINMCGKIDFSTFDSQFKYISLFNASLVRLCLSHSSTDQFVIYNSERIKNSDNDQSKFIIDCFDYKNIYDDMNPEAVIEVINSEAMTTALSEIKKPDTSFLDLLNTSMFNDKSYSQYENYLKDQGKPFRPDIVYFYRLKNFILSSFPEEDIFEKFLSAIYKFFRFFIFIITGDGKPLWTIFPLLWSLIALVSGFMVFKSEKMTPINRETNTISGLIYSPFLYSLDLLLPFVDLYQEKYWLPKSENTFIKLKLIDVAIVIKVIGRVIILGVLTNIWSKAF